MTPRCCGVIATARRPRSPSFTSATASACLTRTQTKVTVALGAVGPTIIRARDADNAVLGNFYLLYGNSGAEVIGDYSDTDFCNAIWEEISPTLDKLEA